MAEVVIDKDVPIPTGRVEKYLFLSDMEVGDSFILLEGMKISSIRSEASRNQIKVKFRTYNNGDTRCWVIETVKVPVKETIKPLKKRA